MATVPKMIFNYFILIAIASGAKSDSKIHNGIFMDYSFCDLSNAIAEALSSIFEYAFSSQNISVLIRINYTELSHGTKLLTQDVLSQLLVLSPSILVPTIIDEQLAGQTLAVHVQVLFIENVHQVTMINSKDVNMRSHFIIVLLQMTKTKYELFDLMSGIFAFFLNEHYNIDVAVLIDADGRDIQCALELYTYFPYKPSKCVSSEPALTARFKSKDKQQKWQRQRITYRQMFPYKLLNLYGCPLSVIVWQIPPYIELNWNAKGKDRLRGIEAEILKAVAIKLNFTLNLLPNQPPALIGGQIHANGSMKGAYKLIYERKANITLGCSNLTPVRSQHLSSTLAYMQMQYIIVLKAAQWHTAYEIMFFPYDLYTWLLVLVFALYHLMKNHSALRFLSLLHGYRSIIKCAWLVIFFILRISYESSIFMFLHNSPMKPLPLTFNQLRAQNYKIITDHSTYRMTEDLPNMQSLTKIEPGQPVDMFDKLNKYPQRTGAFSSKTFLAYYLTKNRHKRSQYMILHETVLDNMICMYFPRDSYMARIVNKQIVNMRSFGLLNHFSKHIDYKNLPATSKAKVLHQQEDGSNQSNLFIYAALNCLLVGHAISLGIFGLEYKSRKYKQLTYLFQCMKS